MYLTFVKIARTYNRQADILVKMALKAKKSNIYNINILDNCYLDLILLTLCVKSIIRPLE